MITTAKGIMQGLLREENIAEHTMKKNQLAFIDVVEDKLENHPLFMNRDLYATVLNRTEGELMALLGNLSYDPTGKYSLAALIGMIILTITMIVMCAMLCRRKERDSLKKRVM